MSDLIPLYHLTEIIFCSRDMAADRIIDWMCQLRTFQLEYKIAPEDSLAVIGSDSIFASEDIYTIPVHAIVQKENLRRKRLFDMGMSLCLLLLLPIDIWFVESKGGFVRNAFSVLSGKKSWVGCQLRHQDSVADVLRPGVLYPLDAFTGHIFPEDMIATADRLYTQDYKVKTDFVTMVKGFRFLGR